ncbi:hypothetical protein pipiens_012574 [Culex pipiens pipiens]|uniref:Integrator complex subunit 5 n=1 Tax=Culex pipiens pipiens TaxID=38569 RepID=A0ABD1D333_CULPP
MIKQPVLAELQYFVSSVSLLYKGVPLKDSAAATALVKCALHLLEDLPSTRDAVFEYFSLVFNGAVKSYLSNVEKNNPDASGEDDTIQEIHEALERLVTNGPPAWSPLISSWSLRLLGEICDKNSRRRPLDIRTSCNLWLGCQAIRCLVGLTALCFSKLDEAEVDNCIAGLLNTFAQYSPYFDWVVARLGGCFPARVIARMLGCGLKRFTGEYDQVDSEVEVLSYLAAANEEHLRRALRDIIEREAAGNKLTVPYLLHLSKNSEVLAQSLAAVFLEHHTDAHLQLFRSQCKFWPANYNITNVVHIVTGLLLKVKKHSIPVLLTLPRLADRYPWCQELLEMLFVELETLVLEKRSCPLLDDATKEPAKELLWRACLSDCALLQQSGVRLILLVSLRSAHFLQQSIAQLLAGSSGELGSGKPHLNALVRLLGGPHGSAELPKIKPSFEIALERMLLNPTRGGENYWVLRNLVEIVKLERDSFNVHLKKTNCVVVLQELLGKLLAIWEMLMNQQKNTLLQRQGTFSFGNAVIKPEIKRIKREDGGTEQIDTGEGTSRSRTSQIATPVTFDQIHMLAKLIDCMELNAKSAVLNMSECLKLSALTVKYFFLCLQQAATRLNGDDDTNLHRCYQLLSRHCAMRKAARTSALREILEGALFLYGNLFGSLETERDSVEYSKPDELLIKLNQKQGIAMNASRSTVLHAGVIGQGPKQPVRSADGPESEMQNRLISAIVACCQDPDQQATIDGFSFMSLLLVELVSPDVMYNGLPWPDEEYTKVTMERDLQIRRMFRNNPILWSLLGLVACYRPALCYSSVLLRALAASVLHQWRSKSAETMVDGHRTELMYVTTKLLEVMALGQLLPPPLSYLHIVLPHLDAAEIVYVLKECVWNYMKDHVPSPVLFVCDPTGFHWRDPASSRPPPQYTNPLRNTMQKRLPKMGTLYQQMFVGPELRNPTVMHQPPQQQIVMVNGLGGSGQPQPMVAAANGNGNMMVMQHHHPHPHQHLPQQQHHHGQMGPGMVGANGNGHLMGNPGPPVILGPVVTLD